MSKNDFLRETLKNVDYQIKEKELLKEIFFLRQYGTNTPKTNITEDYEK